MNRRHLSWIAAVLLMSGFALWSAAAAQDLVTQPSLDAAVGNGFTATATAQPTADMSIPTDFEALLADIPQSRGADGAFLLGNPDAPITVIVFVDWACPHCQSYYNQTVIPFIESEVASGRAALEARLFPTAGGALTVSIAQAVECMVESGASFWALDHALFERARLRTYSADAIRALAADADLSFEEVTACAADADQVAVDVEFGLELGIGGTPAVLIRRGEGAPEFITYKNTTYSRGGVPLAVLAAVVAAAQPN
jgi:protein-disulfide isomerase